MNTKLLDPNRLFPAEASTHEITRGLYEGIKDLPIISPHGHTDPSWFSENKCFTDATSLLLIPDHYLFRMLYSQGTPMENLGVPRIDGGWVETDMRKIWHVLAEQGGQNLPALKKSIDAPAELVLAAAGWLAREGKLSFSASGRSTKISLR